MITELYVDGGVIASNPSMIGGTFAFRIVSDPYDPIGWANVITSAKMGGPVTNNQTEMLALLIGLKHLPDYWTGTIYSDSQVTLGRAFMGWKWKNIPDWMLKMYQEQRARLTYWNEIGYDLLDGHPTKEQLKAGVGKRGHPVSEHNVWCDGACRQAGTTFMESVARNIPSVVEVSVYASQ